MTIEVLSNMDSVLDYVPVISTITNLCDLFLKYLILPRMDSEKIENNHYYTYLDLKKPSRCILLLIPVIGNIIVALVDLRKYIARVEPSRIVDRNIALAAVQQSGLNLRYVSEELCNERDIVLAAARQNGRALRYASEGLRNDREIVLAAVQQDGRAQRYASEGLHDDQEVVVVAYRAFACEAEWGSSSIC